MLELNARFRERIRNHRFLLELFITANLAFLAVDIVIAHSVNRFHHFAEWIPLVYCVVGAMALGVSLIRRGDPETGAHRIVGFIVGWLGVAVGLAGMLWHLESQFFQLRTLRSLVYSAPFVAPLAFAGLGLLLLLNRMVRGRDPGWGAWVVFLSLGGFVGNFGLSLADHAQNGFFHVAEWIPVAVSALGVGYLSVLLLVHPTRGFVRFGGWVLALQLITGVVGFGLHLLPLLHPSSALLVDRIVFGPPVFAPLLFANLALLAGLGLWAMSEAPESIEELASPPYTAGTVGQVS